MNSKWHFLIKKVVTDWSVWDFFFQNPDLKDIDISLFSLRVFACIVFSSSPCFFFFLRCVFGLPSSISCRKSRKIEKIWKILRKLKILFGHVKDSQRKIKKIQWKHDELSGKAKDFLMVQQYSKYRFFDLNCILSFCKDP